MIRNFIIGQLITRLVAFLIEKGVPPRLIPRFDPVEWPQKYDEGK